MTLAWAPVPLPKPSMNASGGGVLWKLVPLSNMVLGKEFLRAGWPALSWKNRCGPRVLGTAAFSRTAALSGTSAFNGTTVLSGTASLNGAGGSCFEWDSCIQWDNCIEWDSCTEWDSWQSQ